MRFAELALMSLPLVLLVAWFMGLRHASYRAFMAMALLLAAFGGGLFWMSEQHAFLGHYTPARLQNGRITPGNSE
jgi:uncharacterized membrane protein YqjE